MKKKKIIKSIIRTFQQSKLPAYTKRDIKIPLKLNKIISIIGVRRCGKTYLLYQLIDMLLESVPIENIVFIDFEDERLSLEIMDMDLIIQGFMELYPETNLAECYFFFDEIQNISGWEKFVRRLFSNYCKNIVITGSNIKMLGSEISTSLRGRSLAFELLPLSFSEYLRFLSIPVDLYDAQSKGKIYNAFNQYLHKGGFPELTHIHDKEIERMVLQEYYQVMIFRDLVEHFNIVNIAGLKFFLKRINACATKQVSVNQIFNEMKSSGYKISKNTLYDFLDHIESIFFAKLLKKYSHKITTQELGVKKVYIIDNGLMNAVIFKFSDDLGKSMEQIVYWELIRRKHEIFFYKNHFECDFVVTDQDYVIQVAYTMDDDSTRKREIKGIIETCKRLQMKQGIILTYDEEDQLSENSIDITIQPVINFLLTEEGA